MITRLSINGVCTTIADGSDSDHSGYTRVTQYRPVRNGATIAQPRGSRLAHHALYEEPLPTPGTTQPAFAQHDEKPTARTPNYSGQGSGAASFEIETLPMPSVTESVRSSRSSSASALAVNDGEEPLELPALNFSNQ